VPRGFLRGAVAAKGGAAAQWHGRRRVNKLSRNARPLCRDRWIRPSRHGGISKSRGYYGSRMLQFVVFPTAEVLSLDASEEQIRARIDRHGSRAIASSLEPMASALSRCPSIFEQDTRLAALGCTRGAEVSEFPWMRGAGPRQRPEPHSLLPLARRCPDTNTRCYRPDVPQKR
jgi:hypothetical protein